MSQISGRIDGNDFSAGRLFAQAPPVAIATEQQVLTGSRRYARRLLVTDLFIIALASLLPALFILGTPDSWQRRTDVRPAGGPQWHHGIHRLDAQLGVLQDPCDGPGRRGHAGIQVPALRHRGRSRFHQPGGGDLHFAGTAVVRDREPARRPGAAADNPMDSGGAGWDAKHSGASH